jgi:hypothetical protein
MAFPKIPIGRCWKKFRGDARINRSSTLRLQMTCAAPHPSFYYWGSRGPLVPCYYTGELYLVNPLAGVEGAAPLAGSGAAPRRGLGQRPSSYGLAAGSGCGGSAACF